MDRDAGKHIYMKTEARSGCFYPEREQGLGSQDTLGELLPRPAASESPESLVKNLAPLLN